jgi:nicotinamide-nucleotide amidase
MRAEILAIGSEMLTPFRVDTNSLYLTEELNRLGIRVTRKTVVGDNREELADALRGALNRAELVIGIGGLGPTEDDVTREAVCDVLGRKLQFREEILQAIQERFRRFGRVMPEINRRQAMVPEGATPLDNPNGTAPGLWLEDGGGIVLLLPGPPPELKPMWENHARARLERLAGATRLFARELRIAGMGESHVEQIVAPIYTSFGDVETTILAAPGEVQLHLRCWSADEASAARLLEELAGRICFALGENVFSDSGLPLEGVVANLLIENAATLAVAESLTGGLIAQRLTSIAGSSSYFVGSMVCYSNEVKSAWVDVPRELIETKGAVSAEVAAMLAEGVRRRSGATLGLGVTGIAGPGGGTPEKPVGTVHIALANGAATRERAVRFPGDRERVRIQASQAALDMVRRYFLRGGRAEKADRR